MTDQTTNHTHPIDDALVAALAERVATLVADVVYRKLRADVLMGDDALLTEEELAQVFHRNPDAVATERRIGVGPQFVRIAGSRKRHYRVIAVRRYLDEIKGGAMYAHPFLKAEKELNAKRGYQAT